MTRLKVFCEDCVRVARELVALQAAMTRVDIAGACMIIGITSTGLASHEGCTLASRYPWCGNLVVKNRRE